MEEKINTNSAAIPMMDLIRELYRFNRTIVNEQKASWRSSSASFEQELKNEINRYKMLGSPTNVSDLDQERGFLFATMFEALTSPSRSS